MLVGMTVFRSWPAENAPKKKHFPTFDCLKKLKRRSSEATNKNRSEPLKKEHIFFLALLDRFPTNDTNYLIGIRLQQPPSFPREIVTVGVKTGIKS